MTINENPKPSPMYVITLVKVVIMLDTLYLYTLYTACLMLSLPYSVRKMVKVIHLHVDLEK